MWCHYKGSRSSSGRLPLMLNDSESLLRRDVRVRLTEEHVPERDPPWRVRRSLRGDRRGGGSRLFRSRCRGGSHGCRHLGSSGCSSLCGCSFLGGCSGLCSSGLLQPGGLGGGSALGSGSSCGGCMLGSGGSGGSALGGSGPCGSGPLSGGLRFGLRGRRGRNGHAVTPAAAVSRGRVARIARMADRDVRRGQSGQQCCAECERDE